MSPPAPPAASPADQPSVDPAAVEAYIARWRAATGSERANYQLFVGQLCDLLGLPAPEPARGEAAENAYCFERRVLFRHGDGDESAGFIDCYRREFSVAIRAGLPRFNGKLFKEPTVLALSREQIGLLAEAGTPLALDAIAARFTGRGPWKKRLPEILDTLAALGRARRVGDEWMAP